MFEKLCDEFFEEKTERKGRPVLISVLAIYYMLCPVLYLVSITWDKVFLNFGVSDWRFAALYCLGAPLLGYLLWTLRVRSHVALYAFLGFEVIRGVRHQYWDVVLIGIAVLVFAMRGEVRSLFRRQHARVTHR